MSPAKDAAAAAPETIVLPLPNGLKLALRSKQQVACAKFIIKEVFNKNSYGKQPGFQLKPTDVVVDVGGNIGTFALWAAPQAARVLSVEPTNAADCLEDSLRLNGITNATCARCAVSEKKGTIELVQYPGFNGVSHSAAFSPATFGQVFIKLLWPRSQSEPVKVQAPCKPFDDILQENKIDRVDFLKVDCEGGEYALFDGTSDATLAKVQRVALEFQELDPSHDYRRIVKRLEDAGFQVKVKRTLIERLFLQTGMIWAIRV